MVKHIMLFSVCRNMCCLMVTYTLMLLMFLHNVGATNNYMGSLSQQQQQQQQISFLQKKGCVRPSCTFIRGGSGHSDIATNNNDGEHKENYNKKETHILVEKETQKQKEDDDNEQHLLFHKHIEKPIQFYIFKGGLCPYAGRTWIVLQELGLPFDMVYIDYEKSKKPDWFLKINPRGRVPAIHNPNDNNEGGLGTATATTSGVTLYESAICNDYLCDYYREEQQTLMRKQTDTNGNNTRPLTSSLLSNDLNKFCPFLAASERAKLRLFQDQFDNNIFPRVRKYIMNTDTSQDDLLQKQCQDALAQLQSHLFRKSVTGKQTTSSLYFLGQDHFTIADAHIIPFVMRWIVQLRHLKKYNLREECEFQSLIMWYDLCQGRQSVKVATNISDETIMKAHYQKVKLLASFQAQTNNKSNFK